MTIIETAEARYMVEKAHVTLSVQETMEGGLWYITIHNAVQDSHTIELGSFDKTDKLIDALLSVAKKYNGIACRSKRTCPRFAAAATCAAISDLAATITGELWTVNSPNLKMWLEFRGF